jgi:GrpB-like predicted nucleotidyltransferase (UPF0157 family)
MNFLFSERLHLFDQNGLGLERDQLRLEKYNPDWELAYSTESMLLTAHLQIESLQLFHCGSTSVPELAAKPILDILGSVPSLVELDAKKANLEKLGYEYKGEYGIIGRRYSVLYSSDKSIAYVHLHLFEEGSLEIEKHLVFRNYLRISETARLDYLEVKRKMALKFSDSRSLYSEGKDSVIQSIQSLAYEHYKMDQKLGEVTPKN